MVRVGRHDTLDFFSISKRVEEILDIEKWKPKTAACSHCIHCLSALAIHQVLVELPKAFQLRIDPTQPKLLWYPMLKTNNVATPQELNLNTTLQKESKKTSGPSAGAYSILHKLEEEYKGT